MSAITVGCMQTYKGSVEKTCDEVDANIKVGRIYTFFSSLVCHGLLSTYVFVYGTPVQFMVGHTCTCCFVLINLLNENIHRI